MTNKTLPACSKLDLKLEVSECLYKLASYTQLDLLVQTVCLDSIPYRISCLSKCQVQLSLVIIINSSSMQLLSLAVAWYLGSVSVQSYTTTLNAWENTLRHEIPYVTIVGYISPTFIKILGGSRNFPNQALLFLKVRPFLSLLPHFVYSCYLL